ncbi:Crp/Fnr family transcriptional regulator [Nocardiopsis gilva YIM 90087]|uniref:Crp/Fnr family transcriptional regulator n=1 Tax=Nocardiopsis gilva YIM 90087 TaxID=1235441 RepID=A0A223SBP1_9ACTN|nr:Crp/Fnr family transcriptional regulator [Nocardiopsis gilva]ASU85588.1 Crp/Fnr family transcriptional regulator [Nocardiopsis gilva YIM 90087]
MGRQGFGALLTDEQWARFLRAGTTRRFQVGEVIIRQGDRGEAVYMLAEGTVKVSMVRTDGTESLIALRGPGESLGELSALSGLPRTATVAASGGSCLTRVLSGAQFRLLVKTMELEHALWEHIVLRQHESESLRAEMAALPAGQRLAITLLRLAASLGSDVSEAGGPPDRQESRTGRTRARRGTVLKFGLTQRELGDSIGLSRASIAAEFGKLRSLGVISTGRRFVAIRDVERLRRLAEGEE